MKKILTLTLVVVLAFAMMAISVSAEETKVELDDLTTNNSTTGDVNVNLSGAENLPIVYSVDVSWQTLDFTYVYDNTQVWNPEDHTYSESTTAGWSNSSAAITVTNHSNALIRAKASFSGGASSLTRNDVTATISNPSFTVASAVGTEPDSAPKGTFTCTVTGVPTVQSGTTSFTVGTITISFEAVS